MALGSLTVPVTAPYALAALALFLFLTPHPRTDLCHRGVRVAIHKLATLIIVVTVFARPLLNALKVDIWAKSLSGVILISALAPQTGEYIHAREHNATHLRERFDDAIGYQMLQYRRDIRLMYARNSNLSGDLPEKRELVADIKASRTRIRRRHDLGELVVGVAIALLALLVSVYSVFGAVGVLLGLYSLLLPISMFMRTTVLDTLAYAGEPIEADYKPIRVRNRRALTFMRAWNEMLVRKEVLVHKLILVSAVKGEFVLGYERGQDLVEKVYTNDMGLEEALDEFVEEQVGEYPQITSRMRWLVKRYVGV